MTTILAKQFENGFILAADSQVTSGDTPYRHTIMQKISRVGDLWIAGAGDAAVCDTIQHLWTPPKMPKDLADPYHFMIAEVVPSMKWALEKANIKTKEDDPIVFIVGIAKRVFVVSDWVVLVSEDGIYGIGTGAPYGIGALAAGAKIEKAITIAGKYDVNTGGRTQIVREGVVNG
jgi:ATP-dependent protease HslVU (ClpYQ) peptidase subunit